MKHTNRREILGSLGALPFLGMALPTKAKMQDEIDAVTGPGCIVFAPASSPLGMKAHFILSEVEG